MKKLTVLKKVAKVNPGCHNGFGLDILAFESWKEIELQKVITLSEDRLLKASLFFRELLNEDKTRKGFVPVLVVYPAYRENGMWEPREKEGKEKRYIDKIGKRQSVNVLQEITRDLTEEAILAFFKGKQKTDMNEDYG